MFGAVPCKKIVALPKPTFSIVKTWFSCQTPVIQIQRGKNWFCQEFHPFYEVKPKTQLVPDPPLCSGVVLFCRCRCRILWSMIQLLKVSRTVQEPVGLKRHLQGKQRTVGQGVGGGGAGCPYMIYTMYSTFPSLYKGDIGNVFFCVYGGDS